MPQMTELRRTTNPPTASPQMVAGPSASTSTSRLSQGGSQTNYTERPHIHIAAIDNSLSFPHEHPKGWRSYTYGWLYLPVTIIGKPFSQKTRDHFLPLLTSKEWWSDTTYELRKLFAIDPDFHPKMFSVSMFPILQLKEMSKPRASASASSNQGAGVEYCSVTETFCKWIFELFMMHSY